MTLNRGSTVAQPVSGQGLDELHRLLGMAQEELLKRGGGFRGIIMISLSLYIYIVLYIYSDIYIYICI